MTTQVKFDYQVMWGDLDANNHLKNTGYLDYASQSRMLYFESRGFGPSEFAKNGVGPATLTDEISYRKELRLLEGFEVRMLCGGYNADMSKAVYIDQFHRADGTFCASVRSLVAWFDIRARKIISAPALLAEAMTDLPRSEDFADLD